MKSPSLGDFFMFINNLEKEKMNRVAADMRGGELFRTLEKFFGEELGEILPCVNLFPGGFLVYLVEDVSYVADQFGPCLKVLWHPHEDRLVGIELEPFDWLFAQMERVLGTSIDVTKPFPFIQFFELVRVSAIPDHRGEEWLYSAIDSARNLLEGVLIPPDILQKTKLALNKGESI